MKSKRCVFCGHNVRDLETGQKRAREHVFPLWALDEFGISRDRINFSTLESNRNDGTSLQLSVQTSIRELDLNNFLLGNVCSTCNNGWMSRLETSAKPTVRRLFAVEHGSLTDERILAKWATKTAYVLSSYLKPPISGMPIKHGRQLVGDHVELPKNVVVFHRQSSDQRVWFSLCKTFSVESDSRDEVERRYRKAYKIFFQFGYAQFLVQCYPGGNIEVAYDPKACSVLNANIRVVADDSIAIADCGITDTNFQFMMSNLIRPRTGSH